MATPGVQYTITVNKTGEGATQAVNDFNAVAAAAKSTNAALAVNTTAITTAAAATKTASSTFKAMNGTLTLLGMTAFPQMTMAAVTAQAAFTGIRTAAAAAGVSMLAVAGPLAVIAAGAYKAYEALKTLYELMEARGAEKSSAAALVESNDAAAAAFLNNVRAKTEAGKLRLSGAENDQLAQMLADNQFRQARELIQGKLPMGEFMTDAEKQREVAARFADDQRVNASASAYARLNVPEIDTDVTRQRQNVTMQYTEQLALLNKMREDGLLTEKEMDNFTMEANTRRVEGLIKLRGQLTENQKIAEKFKEELANGLSAEIVNAFRQGEFSAKRFGEMLSNVFADLAQEILKVKVIMPALNAGFALFGMANGGMAFAASGGMFPQYAANGLAGVGTVSSPTYFPKFNVVAGEAGREMLTVLARPRMMEVGGMQAVVGSAQGRQLAITSASDLARGGAGGTILIQVMGTPDFEARVVSNSVKGAVVQVANDMRQDTPIARGVKGLTA